MSGENDQALIDVRTSAFCVGVYGEVLQRCRPELKNASQQSQPFTENAYLVLGESVWDLWNHIDQTSQFEWSCYLWTVWALSRRKPTLPFMQEPFAPPRVPRLGQAPSEIITWVLPVGLPRDFYQLPKLGLDGASPAKDIYQCGKRLGKSLRAVWDDGGSEWILSIDAWELDQLPSTIVVASPIVELLTTQESDVVTMSYVKTEVLGNECPGFAADPSCGEINVLLPLFQKIGDELTRNLPENLSSAQGPDVDVEVEFDAESIPYWDGNTISFNGEKREVRKNADRQREVLNEFQASGWAEYVDNPFIDQSLQTTTINTMNKWAEKLGIQFGGGGEGNLKWRRL